MVTCASSKSQGRRSLQLQGKSFFQFGQDSRPSVPAGTQHSLGSEIRATLGSLENGLALPCNCSFAPGLIVLASASAYHLS